MRLLRFMWHDGHGGIISQDGYECRNAAEWAEQPQSLSPGWSLVYIGGAGGRVIALHAPPGFEIDGMAPDAVTTPSVGKVIDN